MKKITLMLLGLLPLLVQAQFSESFGGLTGFNATNGWGQAIPAGWVQYNQDGLTPYTSLATYFTGGAAWVSRRTATDTFLVSNSYYTPAGTANDWIVSPTITVPAAAPGMTPWLLWEAMAPDANYPDGYMVKISTTGNAVANFTAPAIFTVTPGTPNGAPGTFESRGVSLASYAGQQINVAFINNSNDMFLLYLDDVQVKNLSSAPEVALLSASVPNRVVAAATNVAISGVIKNNSGAAISSVTASWNDGTGPHSATITGLNIAPLSTATFTHTTPFTTPTANEFDLAMTISNPNGVADNAADNAASAKVSTVSELPKKVVLIEEGTGTWCQWCPRGAVAMDYMYTTYGAAGDFVGIAVHNGDPMTVTAYDNGANLSGYPGCNVDRKLLDESVSQTAFEGFYTSRKTLATPAAVDMTLALAGSALTVNVSSTFKTKMSTGLTFAAVIVEDSVHGTASGYNQANAYGNNANGPMGGFELLPTTVPAAQMWYGHVGRELLGGYDGQTGSIAATVNNGDNATYTFNYTFPATIDINKAYVVGLLIDAVTGEVYNATPLQKVTGAVAINPATVATKFDVYPNPANNFINVAFELNSTKDVTIDVYTTTGQKVLSEVRSGLVGEQNITLNTEKLAAGTYMVSVSYDSNSFIKNFSIAK